MLPFPRMILLVALALVTDRASAAEAPKRPHIVFLLADDLGWKDIGYHGSEIKTPNLDRLAASGAKLEQFYVLPVCSPTRSALMTGRYPMRFGLQSGVVRPWSKHGLALDERTLAQALNEAGYVTAITGKWHLGHVAPEYLPMRRGFDHQYGHYNGAIDYFEHTRDGGYDWHRDDKVLREEGYSTNLIGTEAVRLIKAQDTAKPLFLYVPFNAPHAPLQAPEEYLKRYADIKDPQRRKFAAMVTCLDDNVGHIVAALKDRAMLDNTLIVFSSDNGGPTNLGATNGELRGAKAGLYEGGVRVPAFAAWPGKIKAGTVVNEPLHVVDWYPTLLQLAGAKREQKHPLDGKDLWATLTDGKPTPHTDILINVEPDRGALRTGPWKLIVHGKLPLAEGGKPERVELYNLVEDVSEKTNRAATEQARAVEMLGRLNTFAKEAAPPKDGAKDVKPADFKAPKVWGEKD